MQVTGDRVAVLTDMAIKAENIDEAKAEEARQKAEARLAQKISDEEAATFRLMAYQLKLEIVTPEAKVFSDDVEMVDAHRH